MVTDPPSLFFIGKFWRFVSKKPYKNGFKINFDIRAGNYNRVKTELIRYEFFTEINKRDNIIKMLL